jgi:autotransporter-associated beta strand protein
VTTIAPVSRLSAPLAVLLLLMPLLAAPASAVTCLWVGIGPNNNFSFAPNWSCNGVGRAPVNGDVLQFTNNPTIRSFTPVNDIAGLQLLAVQIDYPRYHISGAGVVLSGDDAMIFDGSPDATDATTATFTAPITLSGPLTISNRAPASGRGILSVGDINLNGFTLTLDSRDQNTLTIAGAIGGSGTITQASRGFVNVFGNNTYTGQYRLRSGVLIVASPEAFGASGPGNETVFGTGPGAGQAASLWIVPTADITIAESFIGLNSSSSTQELNIKGASTVTITGRFDLPSGIMSAAANFTITSEAAIPRTLVFAGPVVGDGFAVFGGKMRTVLANSGNALKVVNEDSGTVAIGAPGAVSANTAVFLSSGAILDLNGIDTTIALLFGIDGIIQLGSATLTEVVSPQLVSPPNFIGTVNGNGRLVKAGSGRAFFTLDTAFTGTFVLQDGLAPFQGSFAAAMLVTGGMLDASALHFTNTAAVTINSPGSCLTGNQDVTIGSLAGSGSIAIGSGSLTVGANNLSTTFSGSINASAGSSKTQLTKVGTGTLTLTAQENYNGSTAVMDGALIVDGTLPGVGGVMVRGGILGGTGQVTGLVATGGAVSPGHSPGILHAASFTLGQNSGLLIDLNGPTAGAGYDQLDVAGEVILNSPLTVTRRFGAAEGATFTIVNVAAGHHITGIFPGLAEGATLDLAGQHFSITYKGGDGNDVVLTALDHPPAVTYYLSEGATGSFFDEDVLIANPNGVEAPVTLTFSKEDGTQVTSTQTIAAQSHATVHVDQIPGLEATATATEVKSDQGLPLVVERTMFWDASHYAGSSGSAVDTPARDWFFAEGSQGFFNTFVLVINPNSSPSDVTFTFLREADVPVTKTVTVGANTRLTLDAGSVPEIVNRSFGISVHATQPIMAERSMYFGTTSTRLWSGGTESAGVTSPSTHWFLAEGATGGFFDTFILLSNPNSADAHVTFQYLLDTGDVVTVPKVVPANARLTTNIEAEDDVRLHNGAISTVVTADQPIIAERSMYWPGAAVPWGEGHNSFGVVDAGLHWGLAEGRAGGPFNFHTYILLANPQSTAASVTVTFLREHGGPVTKTFAVPATSRFNIDTGAIPELANESFGADIQVSNNVPIIAEESMYWDSNGFQFSGGTNATASRLP